MIKSAKNDLCGADDNMRSHYESADINNKIIINFRDVNYVMRFLYEGKGSQKRILIVLLEIGSITQQELTKRLGIQPGTASEVLEKLENSGLIVRTKSEIDRRTTDVKLTKKGKILAKEATEQRNKRHKEMFSCLTENEKITLLSLIEKVNSDWKERYQGAEEYPHGRYHYRNAGRE